MTNHANTAAAASGIPSVTRIARRRARPGQEKAYEAIIAEMFARMRETPGFQRAELLPPHEPGGEYQVITHFDSEAALTRWDTCPARAAFHDRLRAVAEDEPEYRVLTGLEAWFPTAVVPATMHPPRHKMTFVTWLGIFPTAAFYLWFVAPLLDEWPFALRTAVVTGLIVVTMSYLVAPRLTKWLRSWLMGPTKR
jgi:antibiotic biosynthesis monooxygenase (ABM) superfamily enzyme